MTRPLAFAGFLSCLSLISVASAQEAAPAVDLAPIYGGLKIERPVAVQIPDDGTKRRFLIEQTGRIKILPADENGTEAPVFLDLTDRMQVEKDFEEGLLGLAFHPDFKANRKFYVAYSKQGPKRLVISEFQASASNAAAADPASERILMQIGQPEWNHNSGNLLFEPGTGYLFVCVGDGGMKNGVFMMPQKLTQWNGKVLRIDVNGTSPGREYGIPKDNPFVGVPHACEEIWALGLRNPWGAAIDRETGQFWLADVGQDLFEEINLIEKGGNYGWEYREGRTAFPGKPLLMQALGIAKSDPPRGTVFIDPVHEYSHGDGLSITGGYLYRGQGVPALSGHYLYGDWKFGTLWALHYDAAGKSVKANHVLHKAPNPAEPVVQPTGIYPDENGEPIVLDWRGKIFRLVKK
ncbi:MAG: PQQ-dependent sugar dehydrogenase [Verrucomicrobiales bacterium]|nr:PQQ-dependent sugar dehydrogenase [Verrucomicrobiales bacterium]